MPNSRIIGVGAFVPEHVVTNADLTRVMDTTDEWIEQRTGIRERRHVDRDTGAQHLQLCLCHELISWAEYFINRRNTLRAVGKRGYRLSSADLINPRGPAKTRGIKRCRIDGTIRLRRRCNYDLAAAGEFRGYGEHQNSRE